jgi:hypothetical protein
MMDYFFKFEAMPNMKQIHIDAIDKRGLYKMYLDSPHYQMRSNPSTLTEGQFKTLWKTVFDFVKIRESKRVSGKCWTCAYIHELRHANKGDGIMDLCKHLMIMHRSGLFMLERLEYRQRVYEAVVKDPNGTMSSIIDGSSQNHCCIPHAGPNVEFPNGLKQHIEGCLTHGHGLRLYRSFPTVNSDADFTIFCLLNELTRWRDKHNNRFPDTWYIKIDGGSKNANKYLFAMLEYFVIKRVCSRILLTR